MARAERIETILSRTADAFKKRGEVVATIGKVQHRDWTDGSFLTLRKKDARFGDTQLFYAELYELPTLCGQLVLAYLQGAKVDDVLKELIKHSAQQSYGSIMYSVSAGNNEAALKKAGFVNIHSFTSPRTSNRIKLYNLDITKLARDLRNEDDEDDDFGDWNDDDQGEY